VTLKRISGVDWGGGYASGSSGVDRGKWWNPILHTTYDGIEFCVKPYEKLILLSS